MENNHMMMWSDVTKSAGIMALAYIPENKIPDKSALPITLVMDQIRDPGNMGTLLRTALAVGCSSVITTKGSCDIWDPKVLRSAMGAHFRLPTETSVPWSTISNHFISPNYDTKEEDMNDEQIPIYFASNVLDLNTTSITQKHLESLFAPYKDPPYLENIETNPGEFYLQKVDPSYSDVSHSKKYRHAPINCVPYHKSDFTKGCVLIIGGETEGISDEARQMTFMGKGHAVSVPMSQAMESLNSSIAAAIILFEMRKQLQPN